MWCACMGWWSIDAGVSCARTLGIGKDKLDALLRRELCGCDTCAGGMRKWSGNGEAPLKKPSVYIGPQPPKNKHKTNNLLCIKSIASTPVRSRCETPDASTTTARMSGPPLSTSAWNALRSSSCGVWGLGVLCVCIDVWLIEEPSPRYTRVGMTWYASPLPPYPSLSPKTKDHKTTRNDKRGKRTDLIGEEERRGEAHHLDVHVAVPVR